MVRRFRFLVAVGLGLPLAACARSLGQRVTVASISDTAAVAQVGVDEQSEQEQLLRAEVAAPSLQGSLAQVGSTTSSRSVQEAKARTKAKAGPGAPTGTTTMAYTITTADVSNLLDRDGQVAIDLTGFLMEVSHTGKEREALVKLPPMSGRSSSGAVRVQFPQRTLRLSDPGSSASLVQLDTTTELNLPARPARLPEPHHFPEAPILLQVVQQQHQRQLQRLAAAAAKADSDAGGEETTEAAAGADEVAADGGDPPGTEVVQLPAYNASTDGGQCFVQSDGRSVKIRSTGAQQLGSMMRSFTITVPEMQISTPVTSFLLDTFDVEISA